LLSLAVIAAIASYDFMAFRADASAFVGRFPAFGHTTVSAPHSGSSPTLTVKAAYYYPGANALLSGAGYTTMERVSIQLDATQIATAQVMPLGVAGPPQGVFIANITIPATTLPGPHLLQAIGQQTGATGSLTLTVEANWNEWNFTPSGDRYNPYETTIGVGNVATLTVAWRASQASYNHSAPTVVDGVVYSMSDSDGHFQTFDEASGAPLQSYLAVNPTTSPVLANGKLFFGTGYENFQSFTTSGAYVWSYPQDGSGSCLFNSPPTLVGSLVYTGDSCGHVFAFTTGVCATVCAPVWQTQVSGQVETNSPTVVNGEVYIGTSAGDIAVLNDQTGALLYTDTTGADAARAVTIVNNTVYATTSAGLLEAFDAGGCGAATCSPLWTAQMGGAVSTAPAVANGVVYVSSWDKQLYAFSANGCGQSTCSPLWTATTGAAMYSSPTVADGVVFVGSNDYYIYAFNAAGCAQTTCSPVWKYKTGYDVWSSPIVVNGTVYLGGADGTLYAFRPTTSSPRRGD